VKRDGTPRWKWLFTQEELDNALLRDSVELMGAVAAAQCEVGQIVKVRGTIRTARLRPQSSVPMCEVELWDGSGSLTLLWLGRPSIPGIGVGRSLIAQGRISRSSQGSPAIYNPRYELLPNGE
jgi:RecG-like helicase